MKFLAWLLLIVLVLWALRSKKITMRPDKTTVPQLDEPEQMVQCAHCGVYFPASEAISQSDLSFCSEEHRQLHFHS